MENPKLALIPSGYKSGTVYSILPTDGVGDFDFSRGSEAARVRKDGLIETVTNNVPRLDWLNSSCPSLLLEPQSTNTVTYSEDFSQWIANSSPILTSGQLAPDGTLSATKISGTIGSSNIFLTSSSTTASRSIYARTVSGTGTAKLMSYFGNTNNLFTLTEEWQRFELTGSSTAGGANFYIDFRDNAQTLSEFIIWGAQSEELSFATSYIPTSGSTVTRLQDFIDGSGSSSLFNSLESTFFLEMASFLNAQTNSNGIELADISGQNRITLQYDTPNNQIRCDVRVLNSAQAIITTQSFDVTNFNKMAITYKLNEVKFYVNGQLIGTDTSVNLFAPNTLTEVRSTIAGISSGAFNLQAKIKDLRVYDRVLTDTEIIKLTTI